MMVIVQSSLVQFKMVLCARKSPYALHPVSEKFPQSSIDGGGGKGSGGGRRRQNIRSLRDTKEEPLILIHRDG